MSARAGRIAVFLFLCLAASFLLLSSCRTQTVSGFVWKDAAGAALIFTQTGSWPAGEEGRFAAGRQSNRYSLAKSFAVPALSSIVVEIRRGAAAQSSTRVKVSLSPKRDGSSPTASPSFPLLAGRVYLTLPIDTGARIASLSVSEEGTIGDFSIESIALSPSFRGIEIGPSDVRVSSGFTLASGQGYQELSIEKPFTGVGEAGGARGQGIFIEYGNSAPGGSMRLAALSEGGASRVFAIRTHPGGARTVLDPLLIGDCSSLRLRAPEGLEIKAFYAAVLGIEDYELADLGRVLLSKAPIAEYSVYRWDLIPSVLIFDFKDYATQDRYLKRLAFFVEKLGYRGTLLKDEDIAALHGWNAHDYGSEDLAAFFRAAREKSFPLDAAEKELEGVLLREAVIVESGGTFEPGKGAMISIARESGDALRWTFAVHESTHAIFFSDADYRRFARSLWSSLEEREKWFWKTYLGWAAYDVGSDYLMGNEFQAYLLQQPTAAVEEYFVKRKSAELLEKHPELEEKVNAYMAEFGSAFTRRAKELEAWLYKKYGVEAGRTVFLTRSKN